MTGTTVRADDEGPRLALGRHGCFHPVNRRHFVQQAALASAGLALAPRWLRSQPARAKRKPNLLFLWTDQQRCDTLAGYGNPRVVAPNLNAFARQAIQFDQAYVTQPVCTPSRSSVLTGLWPHQNGCVTNNVALRPEARCFPQLLADPDYRTGYIGKWHLGDEVFAQHGFEEWVSTEDMYERHFSAGRDRHAKSDYWRYLQDRGYKPDKGGYYSRPFACRLPIEDGKPAFQARKAREFLTRHRREPFVLHVSYLEPHTPYVSPLHTLYPVEAMQVDDSYIHDDRTNTPRRHVLRQRYFAAAKGYQTDTERKDIATQYLGNISVVDRSVGEILNALESLGLAEDTIVVFTSDHGDQLSAHGMWFKEVMYQESLHVPYLLRVPGARGGRRVAAPVSHIDLVPTLLDLMDVAVPESLPGQSLMPLVHDAVAQPRPRFVFAQWSPDASHEAVEWQAARAHPDLAPFADESSRLVLSPDGWKLCVSDIDRGQLYHLRADPHEQHNLYYTSEHQPMIARLTKELDRWRERTGDATFRPPT